MRISEMNWMMVEEYLKRDDRSLLPLGTRNTRLSEPVRR